MAPCDWALLMLNRWEHFYSDTKSEREGERERCWHCSIAPWALSAESNNNNDINHKSMLSLINYSIGYLYPAVFLACFTIWHADPWPGHAKHGPEWPEPAWYCSWSAAYVTPSTNNISESQWNWHTWYPAYPMVPQNMRVYHEERRQGLCVSAH